MESAIIAAATRKAEMQTREAALKTKLALELEEYKLQEKIRKHEDEIKFKMMELEQQRRLLEMRTEIEVEDR